MQQVASVIAEPMYGLMNELDDGFHCSAVLQGLRVFELAYPHNLQELMEYGKVLNVFKLTFQTDL